MSGATDLPAFVAGRGGSSTRVLRAAGIVEVELRDADGWLPLERMTSLYEAAARELADPYFGLTFGRSVPLRAYGPLSYVVLNAADVRTALENLSRYTSRLSVSGAVVRLAQQGDAARLVFELPSSAPDASRQYVEAHGAILCVMMTALAGPDWRPREVAFAHAPVGDSREVERILACKVRYCAALQSITFDAAYLERAVPGADRDLLPLIERQLGDVLAVSAEDAFVAEVGKEIARVLCDGKPSIARVARRLAMSPRTLQRRLLGLGLRFKTLVNRTRIELAKEYLVPSGPSVTEIAFLLGYGELSAFDRAFRRETGKSPTGWRKQHANHDSAT